MSSIWLRCVVVDASGVIVRRFEEHPLPPALDVSQLSSYLEQRFGPPLATQTPGAPWRAFRSPKGEGGKNTVLLAIPLMDDPETKGRVPVFEKMSQLKALMRSLGGAALLGTASLDEDEEWVGPFFDSGFLRQLADDAAARAARAWMTALGLSAEIEWASKASSETPVPAPGLGRLKAAVDAAAQMAAARADRAGRSCGRVATLAEAVALAGPRQTSKLKRLREAEEALIEQYRDALAAAERAEHGTRALAQLAFGVSACNNSSDRIERLDRAGVAVLHPPDGYGVTISLLRDGVSLQSSSMEELSVEIAGIACRILIDRGTRVRLEVPGSARGAVELEVEPGDVLRLTAYPPTRSGAARVLKGAGWKGDPRGPLVQRWPSPVPVIVAARLAAETLFGAFDLDHPGRLIVKIDPATTPVVTPNEPDPSSGKGWVM